MSTASPSEAPELKGNSFFFDTVYKLVCGQAAADCQPPEVVLAQVIYHASYELLYSDDFTLAHVRGLVDAAALTVAREYEEAESLGAGGAA
ncbi:hypothetical protein [Pseudomonas sp. GZD-209]|uniref:hypothetical protein n=1 Tax=Pseudomonas sp. GZD-209 TaxID=3404807 RepID=UPI003BB74A9C